MLCCFLLVVAISLFVPGIYALYHIKKGGLNETLLAATNEAKLAALLLNEMQEPEALPRLIDSLGQQLGQRVTLISPDGEIIAESTPGHGPLDMDNHSDRVEIVEAARKGIGSSVRHSNTLDIDFVFVAAALTPSENCPAGFVRIAVPLERVDAAIAESRNKWLGILGMVLVLAVLLASTQASFLQHSLKEMIRMVESIAATPGQEGREAALRRRRLHVVPGKEFRPLARAVNAMADRTESQMETIAGQKAQLETILGNMDEGVMVVDAQGRVRMVNPALTRFFPLAADSAGKLPVEIVPSADVQESLEQLLGSPASDKNRIITFEIEPRPEMILGVHIIRPKETVHDVMAIAVFHDISETARLVRSRKEFVANVSHELRTPLTAIIGYAETLQDTPPDRPEMTERFAGIIARSARNMSAMVDDLLVLSRIESGAVPIEPVPVLVESLLEEVRAVCAPLAEESDQQLAFSMDEGLNVMADSRFVSQVFRNLVENACRYAPKASTITITGRARQDGMAEFAVLDQGPGIPLQELTRIFERFYRLEKHRGNPQSTGLGLAICKHIVERLGGTIWAEKGPGGTFRFTLPLVGQNRNAR